MSIKDRYISLRDEKGVTNYVVSDNTEFNLLLWGD